MFKKIDKEIFFGGLFGIIAVLSAICEMIANGLSAATIFGTLKDITGTLVAVMVLGFAMKKLFDNSEKKLSKLLEKELASFEQKYSPLIFKVSNFEKMQNEKYEQGFCILKDFSKFITTCDISEQMRESYSSRNSHQTAKFVDLPSVSVMLNENFKICFRTLSSCEYDKDFLTNIGNKISFNYKENGYVTTSISNTLIVEIPKIETKQDIESLISMFEIVLICFEIGNKGIKVKE